MKYNTLGKTNIKVSQICYGSLTLGPLQSNLDIKEGAKLIIHAYENGINFIDTAQSYMTYKYIKEALKTIPREKLVIFSKSYAYDISTAKTALEGALEELDTYYIDGFLLHEQESEHTLRGHFEATEYFLQMKEAGIIKSFGISTHMVNGVKGAIESGYVDVIHPLFNKEGLGIVDGNSQDMYHQIKLAHKKGIGIYSMKPLGGGNLIESYDDAMNFVVQKQHIDSIAIGMQSKDEIDSNIAFVQGQSVSDEIKNRLRKVNRKLLISDWCTGCGKCVKRCIYGALTIENNVAKVDQDKCLLCTYCSRECPDFCIKVI